MPSVRVAICLSEKPTTLKGSLQVCTFDDQNMIIPSVCLESANLGDLQREVIQQVLTTFKTFRERNRTSEKRTVKIREE